MSPLPLDGRVAAIADDVGCLVTLGTPHHLDPGVPRWRHAGVRASSLLERVHARRVVRSADRLCVGRLPAASSPRPSASLSPGRRACATSSRGSRSSQPPGPPVMDWSPRSRPALPGARHLSFDDVLHGTFGGPWYGDLHVIDRWWPSRWRRGGVRSPPGRTRQARGWRRQPTGLIARRSARRRATQSSSAGHSRPTPG